MTSSILGGRGPGTDVLLVYPAYETILEKRGRFLTTIPLGIAYLASSLEADGFKVAVLDLSIQRTLSIQDIAKIIIDANPRILCFSLTSMGLRQAHDIIQEIRIFEFHPTVVVGGPHVTADQSIVVELDVDYGIAGEGEYSLLKLCNYLLRDSGTLAEISGLIRKSGRQTIIKQCDFVQNLDALPFPARSLFDTKRYNYVSLISSRGCPFECSYCTTAKSPFRQRSIENVFDEIKRITDTLNLESIAFVDNVFTMNRTFTLDFCRRVKERTPNLRWTCSTRADLVDDDLIRLMASSGCDRISFGVESGVEEIRFSVGKKIRNQQYEAAFKACREDGIKTSAYFMLGHIGETRKDIDNSIDFALKLDPDDVFFTPSIILPKTKLMEYCLGRGLVSKESWISFMKSASDVPYILPDEFRHYTADTLQLYAMRKYFLNPTYVSRSLARARSANDLISSTKLIAGILVDKVFIRQDIIPYDI